MKSAVSGAEGADRNEVGNDWAGQTVGAGRVRLESICGGLMGAGSSSLQRQRSQRTDLLFDHGLAFPCRFLFSVIKQSVERESLAQRGQDACVPDGVVLQSRWCRCRRRVDRWRCGGERYLSAVPIAEDGNCRALEIGYSALRVSYEC